MRLKVSTENEVLFVEQGKTFNVNLECVDEDDKVTTLGMLLLKVYRIIDCMHKGIGKKMLDHPSCA